MPASLRLCKLSERLDAWKWWGELQSGGDEDGLLNTGSKYQNNILSLKSCSL